MWYTSRTATRVPWISGSQLVETACAVCPARPSPPNPARLDSLSAFSLMHFLETCLLSCGWPQRKFNGFKLATITARRLIIEEMKSLPNRDEKKKEQRDKKGKGKKGPLHVFLSHPSAWLKPSCSNMAPQHAGLDAGGLDAPQPWASDPTAVSCARFSLLLKSGVNSPPFTARARCPCWDLGCSVPSPSSKRLGCSLEAEGSGAACHGVLATRGWTAASPLSPSPVQWISQIWGRRP